MPDHFIALVTRTSSEIDLHASAGVLKAMGPTPDAVHALVARKLADPTGDDGVAMTDVRLPDIA